MLQTARSIFSMSVRSEGTTAALLRPQDLDDPDDGFPEHPGLARSTADGIAEYKLGQNLRNKRAQARVLQVFGGQKNSENALHQELTPCCLILLLLLRLV